MKEKMMELYTRTLKNCQFYEKENDKLHLLSEIGCLRGIGYCLEEIGYDPARDPEFIRFIGIAFEELKGEPI